MPNLITNAERFAIQFATSGRRDRANDGGDDADDALDSEDAEPTREDLPASAKVAMSRLNELAKSIRLAARAGDEGASFAALRKHAEFTTQLRQQNGLFSDLRQDLATLALGMLQPTLAAQDALRFVGPNAPRPRLRDLANRFARISQVFGAVFQPAADWLAGKADAQGIINADLGLVADFRKLGVGGQKETDFLKSFAEPLESAVRLGAEAGLKVVAIPAFAFPLLKHRPAHILSFHSTGLFDGFTHYKRADLPGYISLDRGGYSGWSTLSEANLSDLDLPPLPEATEVCKRLWQQIVAANVSKYIQNEINDEPESLPERFVFVALQVASDRTQDMARFTMDAMLDIVVTQFRGTDTAVVVKPHPKSYDLDHLGRLMALAEAGDIVLRFDGIHHLISRAQAVITINSGVGSETLLHRKPIYCFGAADYDVAAHRITSADQFAALTTPIRPALGDDDLTRFNAYYRTRYLVERDVPGRLDQAIRQRVIDPALAAR